MRSRTRFLILVVLALLVAAVAASCGDDDAGETTTPTTAASTTTTSAPTNLSAVLLTAGDVGARWKLGQDVNEADFHDATNVPCPDVAVNEAITHRLTPVAGVQFEPADGSYEHLIEFVVTGEASQLATDLQAFLDAIASCPSVPMTAGTSTAIRPLTIPSLGGQRAAFTMTGTESAGGPTWFVRTATVRIGGRAAQIGLTEILTTPQQTPVISDAEFVALVEKAAAKLDG